MSGYNKPSSSDLDGLRRVLGPQDVSTDRYDLLTNAFDAYPGELHLPDVVVWPETAEEVSLVLRLANEKRIPVYVRGAGTGLAGACVPVYGGIVINTMKMNRILDVRPLDLQVDVQPGVIYDQLNAHLAPYGLFFPPDPGSSKSCTIGGMIANNASGLRAVRYGVTRDYVLSMELVLPSGELLRVGANVFKSSVGYDVVRLIVGSEGTLGVITNATLRLRKLPRHRSTVAAYFDSIEGGVSVINAIRQEGLDPAAIEFLDRIHIELISKHSNVLLPTHECMLILEFHGYSANGVADEVKTAAEILKESGSVQIELPKSSQEEQRIWDARKAMYPSVTRATKAPITGDIIVPLSKLYDTVQKAYDLGKRYGVVVGVAGHLGDGNVHTNWFTEGRDTDSWLRAMKANSELVDYAISVGGAASAEHGIGIEKKDFMRTQHGEGLELMRRIKALFDPEGILNPGVMI
ncbi:MAG: FAD-binding oxidoreductase [Thaumarchaeota archaeon]|nr:FAD-binding oxidoreductase [Candidatus Calditenuaceae archaeon]MDW8187060.1 FAD-binding oxidoreductase [Nitrososphaerota archaeon]